MLLYRTTIGQVVQHEGRWFRVSDEPWQDLINRDDLSAVLGASLKSGGGLSRRRAKYWRRSERSRKSGRRA